MLDPDDLEDALAAGAQLPRDGQSHIPSARAIRGLKGQFRRVLAELPDDLTVRDLRELLEATHPNPSNED